MFEFFKGHLRKSHCIQIFKHLTFVVMKTHIKILILYSQINKSTYLQEETFRNKRLTRLAYLTLNGIKSVCNSKANMIELIRMSITLISVIDASKLNSRVDTSHLVTNKG